MKDPFSPNLEALPISDSDPLESKIQSDSVRIARKRGYWARKFSSPANRSVPDYLFARWQYKDKFAVEFKRKGKTSTEAQIDEQAAMREAGWDVYECDSVVKFVAVLDSREKNATT